MSRAKLERRLEVLEVERRPDPSKPSPWAQIYEEMRLEALEDLTYILEMEHPEDSHEWNIIYAEPPHYVGPEWVKSGPEAAHMYRTWCRETLPSLTRPGTRPPRQAEGWPTYPRPVDELDAKICDVLLADAPTPETFERWLTLLEIR